MCSALPNKGDSITQSVQFPKYNLNSSQREIASQDLAESHSEKCGNTDQKPILSWHQLSSCICYELHHQSFCPYTKKAKWQGEADSGDNRHYCLSPLSHWQLWLQRKGANHFPLPAKVIILACKEQEQIVPILSSHSISFKCRCSRVNPPPHTHTLTPENDKICSSDLTPTIQINKQQLNLCKIAAHARLFRGIPLYKYSVK